MTDEAEKSPSEDEQPLSEDERRAEFLSQYAVHPHEFKFKLVKTGVKKFSEHDTIGEAYDERDKLVKAEMKKK